MGFNTSLISFFVLIIAYLIILEVFTVLFRLTGLREDKARFQAVSCMTNSGFTTKESELILNSVSRRYLARSMMIFGYLFAVTGVSLLVNIFIRSSGDQISWRTIGYSVAFLMIIAILTRSRWVIQKFDHVVEKVARHRSKGEFCNNVRVLEMLHDQLIAEVLITCLPREIAGKTLLETNFRHRYKIDVLLIRRGKNILEHIKSSEQLYQGDKILVYGTKENILELFKDVI